MKLSITPVALAVTMALGAVVAHAQSVPSYGTTNPSETGLYLAVWDDTTGATDLVNLTLTFTNASLLTGAGVPTTNTGLTTPTSAYTEVANPTGAAGMVEQLNLGTISNFSSVFPASSISAATNYVVVSSNTGETGALVSSALGSSNALTNLAVPVMAGSIIAETSNWAGYTTTSPLADTSTGPYGGKAAFNVATEGALGDGNLGLEGNYFGTHVGSAAQFYNYSAPTSGANNGEFFEDEYGNSVGAGFWFLSSTGDLSWNLLVAASTVPLPPAVWLFASGLIGLVLIGRRRQSGIGAAV